jgi:flagellar hook-associated protein 2
VGTSASPEYKIVITSNNSGTEQGTLAVSNEALVSASYSLNQAKDSQFTMSGISGTITRSSNIINDVVTGLTFSLNSTGSAKISVADDSTASAAAMQEFVDAYNEVVNFVKENDFIKTEQKDGQNVNTFGPLSSSNLDENLLTALRNALSGAATSGGTVNTLADLGVTTQRDGTLAFNSDTFKDAVVDDSSNARTILSNLGERLGAVDGTIAQFTRFNGLIDSERQSNQHQITSLQTRISDVEAVLSRQEASLTQRFARLEAIMGNLNSQQSTLAALLPQY